MRKEGKQPIRIVGSEQNHKNHRNANRNKIGCEEGIDMAIYYVFWKRINSRTLPFNGGYLTQKKDSFKAINLFS